MKGITLLCSALMFVVLLFPIWKIDLTAPQYPEGLTLKIHANKLAGNVNVINGLNHYIGMRTLHTEDFIEFTVLPYIISGFAALGIVALLLNRRKYFNAWVVLFVVIAIVAMTDFYKWEYEYGHELNPDAPIKVPGMSYTPPLIGYKQLLNFSAYSIPDAGGWIFVGVGVVLVTTWFLNRQRQRKESRQRISSSAVSLVAMFILLMTSCSRSPQPVKIGADACDYCKMTIMDEKFAAECISTKGKIFKFDDVHCLISFLKFHGVWRNEIYGIYFSDFYKKNNWIKADEAAILKSENFRSPMGGNMAAFAGEADCTKAKEQFQGEPISWKDINPLKELN